MRTRTKRKLDMTAFVGAVLTFAGFLVWFLTALPR